MRFRIQPLRQNKLSGPGYDPCLYSDGERPVLFLKAMERCWLDEEGVQRWIWWPVNEKLKGHEAQPGTERDFQSGIVAEGSLNFSGRDGAEIRFDIDGSQYAVRVSNSGAVDFLKHDCEQSEWVSLQQADRQLPAVKECSFRLLARCGMAEFYLDDHFMECCTLGCPNARSIRVTASEQGMSALQLWDMDL